MASNSNSIPEWNDGKQSLMFFGDTSETPFEHQMNLQQIKPTKINKIIDYNHNVNNEKLTTHVNINDNNYHPYSWFDNDEPEHLNQNDYRNIILKYIVNHYDVSINDNIHSPDINNGYQDGSYVRIPDIMHDDADNRMIIIGWCKTDMDDLFSMKHAVKQYNRLQSQYLAFMNYLNDDKYADYNSKILILAVPFELYAAAISMINELENNAYMINATNVTNVDFRIITEINDVSIPSLIGWSEPELGVIQSDSMKINDIECDYDDMIISINDDRIQINDAYKHTYNSMSDYESIRNANREFISDSQVNKRLTAYYDDNDIIIVNGMNDLMNARFITENALSAPSYSYVNIRCFRNVNNDDYMLTLLSEHDDNNHKVNKYFKAVSIIRMHDVNMMGFDEIKDKADLNSLSVIDYYHTGKLLNMFAYDDNEKDKLFDYAYELFKSNFTLHDVYTRNNITRSDVIAFIHDNSEYMGSMNYYKNTMLKCLKESASYDAAMILCDIIIAYKKNNPVIGSDDFKEKISNITDISCNQLMNAVNAHGKPLLNAVMRMLALDYEHYSNNGFMNTNKNDGIMEIIDCFQTLSSELNSAVDTLKILMSMNDDNGNTASSSCEQ